MISKNPFDGVKISKGESFREFLTEIELKQIFDYYLETPLSKERHEVLRAFLFSCHTGIVEKCERKKIEVTD